MEAVDGESAVRGLLVTLLNLFNVDSGSTLSRLEFTAGAAALGYDISDEKWAGLYKRFAMANAPDDEDHEVEELDLSLLGERFHDAYAVCQRVYVRFQNFIFDYPVVAAWSLTKANKVRMRTLPARSPPAQERARGPQTPRRVTSPHPPHM